MEKHLNSQITATNLTAYVNLEGSIQSVQFVDFRDLKERLKPLGFQDGFHNIYYDSPNAKFCIESQDRLEKALGDNRKDVFNLIIKQSKKLVEPTRPKSLPKKSDKFVETRVYKFNKNDEEAVNEQVTTFLPEPVQSSKRLKTEGEQYHYIKPNHVDV